MQTKKIYNKNAAKWVRTEPNVLTDFSVRPLIFDWCGDLTDKSVIDLGCGEGYVSRYCKSHGAARVLGVDISEGMIESAKKQEHEQPLGIEYQNVPVQKVTFAEAEFDIALGVFVFNYLTVAETKNIFKNVYQWLKPKGKFIFSLPHPSLPFLGGHEPPVCFDHEGYGYFSGRDKNFPGKLWCLNDEILDIQMLHKTFADIFACLQGSGFNKLPELSELAVPAEFKKHRPDFCQQDEQIPLNLVIKIEK